MKSKRRYEINKGRRNFTVKMINPMDYQEDLYRVTVAAYSGWPEKYRPKTNKDSFVRGLDKWGNSDVFGVFGLADGVLDGYALLSDYGYYVEFCVLRVDPGCENMAINAAAVAGILDFYKERFANGFYISDGSRSIRHETAFQDYLEKYFEFRKVYCRLNLKYRPGFGALVKFIYPFRKVISANSRLGSKISAILKMEEIRRTF